MIANINAEKAEACAAFPKTWPGRPYLFNYDKLPAEELYKDGWREVLTPKFDAVKQRLGVLYFDKEADAFTYKLEDRTPEELEAERRALVPFSITPTQGRIMLSRAGLLTPVSEAVAASEDETVKIYFEYALSWDRNDEKLIALARSIGLDNETLDGFFIEASKI